MFRSVHIRTLLPQYLLIVFLLSATKPSSGSHAAGADITYRWIQDLGYEVTVTFYRDCAGIPARDMILHVTSSCDSLFEIYLAPTLGAEITTPCQSQQTTCACANGSPNQPPDPSCLAGKAPGIQKYIYQTYVELPVRCSDWTFAVEEPARNCAITTIQKPSPCGAFASPPPLRVEARLNNIDDAENSSPVFSNIPITFVCSSKDLTYNHGVIDPDGDSVVYAFINPLGADDMGMPVTYLPGYSYLQPVTSSPAVSLNASTGDIFMHPVNNGEISIMAILVSEFRNGKLIGQVIRDMQFYVIPCSNTPPTASGFNCGPSYTASACAGKQICFDICTNDIDASQIVSIDWNGGIGGASFTDGSGSRPTGHFCWTPTVADVGTHAFTVTVGDNACPQNALQSFSYTIEVGNIVASVNPVAPLCEGDSVQLSSIAVGAVSYSWNPPTDLNVTTIADPVCKPSSTTNYTLTVNDIEGCMANATVKVVVDAIPIAAASPNAEICAGESALLSASGGSSYLWMPADYLDNIHSQHPHSKPSKTIEYSVVVSNGSCPPDTAGVRITVHDLPIIAAYGDTTITAGEEIILNASGGLHYEWTPDKWLSCSTCENTFAQPRKTTQYIVTSVDGNGCRGMDTVTVFVNEIFRLFVPNAFTPTKDNRNDLFFAFGEGIEEFDLAIYNRWGDEVFHTSDITAGWNGNNSENDMQSDVYVWKISARSSEGEVVSKTGTVTIVR